MRATGPIELAELGEDFVRDPYPLYSALRDRGPVHRVRIPEGLDVWLVVNYEVGRAALADPRLSSDWSNGPDSLPRPGGGVAAHMLYSDPPDHRRLRRLMAGEFTMRRVEQLIPRVQDLVDELVDSMIAAPDSRADLIESLAFPLSIGVISDLLGVPSLDVSAFRALSNRALSATDLTVRAAAKNEMTTYLTGLLDDKRAATGDDLMTALIRTTDEDGGQLSAAELLSTAWLLLVAGFETSVNLIANALLALLTHSDQLVLLRHDPSLIDNAVEEVLRYNGPLATPMFRFTTTQVEIGGTTIPKREIVLISLASMNRDPARFTDPDRFDIRRPPQGHVAFGHGIHFCLGAPLARINSRTAIGTLLRRFPHLALDVDPAAVIWRQGTLLRGPSNLQVRLGS